MAQQITIDIVAETAQLRRGLEQTNQQLTGLQSGVNKLNQVTTAVAGIGVAAAGLSKTTGFINDITEAASDLAETSSKVEQIFGTASTAINEFASTAAKSIGQSKQQALDAAATFGIFGKAAGLAGTDLADFSTDFTVLASDLASFNNTTPEDAIVALGAALRGEAEPLRRYGILLDNETLKSAAFALGIYDGATALTAQQKVLAAQKVIFEQTSVQQGDFARTSEGLANRQRILAATQADLNANLGQTFLPIMIELNKILQLAVDVFTSLPGPVQKITLGIGLLVATIGPLLILISSIKTAFIALGVAKLGAATASGILTVATTALNVALRAIPILAVIALIVLIIKNFDNIREAIGKVIDKIKEFVPIALEKIKEFADKIAKFALDVVAEFLAIPEKMAEIGKNIVRGLWNGISSLTGFLRDKVGGFFKNLLPGWAEKALGISSPSKVFAEVGKNIIGGLASTFNIGEAAKAITAKPLVSSNIVPISSMPSFAGSAPINVTINAGLGTDPVALGRSVNNALSKYGKVSPKVRRG